MVFKRIFQTAWLKLSKKYSGCHDLPLRNFLDVMSTGDFKYLYKLKSYHDVINVTSNEMSMLWNDIILEYADLDNNLEIASSFENQKIVYQLENSYVVIKSMIRILMFVTPDSKPERYSKLAVDTISSLSKLGYSIDLSSTKAYKESVFAADKRANSIINQINIRKSEMSQEDNNESKGASFEQIIASLNSALGFQVSENITVAAYCEYKKVISKRSRNVT